MHSKLVSESLPSQQSAQRQMLTSRQLSGRLSASTHGPQTRCPHGTVAHQMLTEPLRSSGPAGHTAAIYAARADLNRESPSIPHRNSVR